MPKPCCLPVMLNWGGGRHFLDDLNNLFLVKGLGSDF